MRRRLLICCLSFTAALPCAGIDTIYLVRHAEKEASWPAQRELDALHPLSAVGLARAAKLVQCFEGVPLRAVYASSTTRALHTGLAVARQAEVELIAAPESSDAATVAQFVAQLALSHPEPGAVLIVGHSNTIPWLLRAFGASEECDAALGVSAQSYGPGIEGYDGLWRIRLALPGCAGFALLSQSAGAP